MKTDNFKQGDSVIYLPRHAKGDLEHKDRENGIVSNVNDRFVFVKYSRPGCDIESMTAKATDPDDLILIKKYEGILR